MLERIVDITVPAKVTLALNPIDITGRYKWAMSNIDINVAKELGLTGVMKYWRYDSQIEIKLDLLHDWISVLTTFLKHSRRVYNNIEMS